VYAWVFFFSDCFEAVVALVRDVLMLL